MSTMLWQWGFALLLFASAELFVFFIFRAHDKRQAKMFAEHLERLRQHYEKEAALTNGDAE